mgnify:CR=1 FL=1|jgi:hypothetical protein
MPKQHIEGLIGQLHDKFANTETSAQQDAMIAQMQSQLADWEGPNPPRDFRETAELLYQELEDEHPTAARLIQEVINTLTNICV